MQSFEPSHQENHMSKLKIAVIIGATRDSRFGHVPAQWIYDLAKADPDIDAELVDLKIFDLPMFNEMASNAWMPSADKHAIAWQKKVGEFDGYIIVTPEYNHSVPASLKNAFDQCSVEWGHKPVGFVGYGMMGAARAVEHARGIASELQMVSTRNSVHIAGGEFVKVHPGMGKQPFDTIIDVIKPSAVLMLKDLVWWGKATKSARSA
jgi:NAD(P)H-dependent FMN reductase